MNILKYMKYYRGVINQILIERKFDIHINIYFLTKNLANKKSVHPNYTLNDNITIVNLMHPGHCTHFSFEFDMKKWDQKTL